MNYTSTIDKIRYKYKMKFQQQSVFVIYIRDQSRFNKLACLTSKLLRNDHNRRFASYNGLFL